MQTVSFLSRFYRRKLKALFKYLNTDPKGQDSMFLFPGVKPKEKGKPMYAYQVLDTNGKEVFPILAEKDEEILRKVVRKNIRQTTFDGEKGSIKFFSESRKKTDKGTTIVTLTLLPKEKRHRTVSSRVQVVTDLSKL